MMSALFSPFLVAAALILTACQPLAPQSPLPSTPSRAESEAQTSPAQKNYGAYMIVMGSGYEPAALGPYAASLPPIYAKYGGEYVAFSTKFTEVEGAFGAQAIIISGWPSEAAAQAFWDSPEYAVSKSKRDGIGKFNVVIVPALPR